MTVIKTSIFLIYTYNVLYPNLFVVGKAPLVKLKMKHRYTRFTTKLLSVVFAIVDYEFEVGSAKLEMADPIWRTFFLIINPFNQIWYTVILGVTNHEPEVRFSKFKMAYPRWVTKFLKINRFLTNLLHWSCCGRG